jgi:hypothetical protein
MPARTSREEPTTIATSAASPAVTSNAMVRRGDGRAKPSSGSPPIGARATTRRSGGDSTGHR